MWNCRLDNCSHFVYAPIYQFNDKCTILWIPTNRKLLASLGPIPMTPAQLLPASNYFIHMTLIIHDDIIKWKHFPRQFTICAGNSPLRVNSPHKGQWRRALVFSLICVWINGWVNTREAGDLRRHRAHYDVIVMRICHSTMKTEPVGRLVLVHTVFSHRWIKNI